MRRVSHSRAGVVYGLTAYGLWGLLPLYWKLLDHVGAIEVLANRMIWSLLMVIAILALMRHLHRIRGLGWRSYGLLALAGAIMAVNWGVYIWAVSHGHVIETSLGYFINPLVTVLVAVVVLRERLRRSQWVAVGIAAVAVVVLTINYGRPPWIGLILAFTFSFYSLIKKKLRVPAVESVAVETAAMFPPALAFLIVIQINGDAEFGHLDFGTDVLIIGTGLVTAVPMMLFAAAASRATLTSLGVMQYLGPTLQFILGIVIFREDVPTIQFIGFGLVWIALVIFTADALNYRRRRLSELDRTTVVG